VETSQQQGRLGQTEDGDYVEFFRAGTRVTGIFQCVSCQNVHAVRGVLRPCAACGERLWERGEWSPFGRGG
jgi:hypothetical protein